MKRLTLRDKLDCPYCGFPYGEEEMEKKIWGLFKCERCFKKIRVAIIEGSIKLQKRLCRMKYYPMLLAEMSDHKYMDSIIKQCIFTYAKQYDQQTKHTFFTDGKRIWVRNSRAMFFKMCDVAGIPSLNVRSYFKKHGGLADNRTIKKYINDD